MNRKMRRDVQRNIGYLKIRAMLRKQTSKKSFLEYLKTTKESRAEGRDLHKQNVQYVEQQKTENLIRKEQSIRDSWKSFGLTKAQIDEKIKKWYAHMEYLKNKKRSVSYA